MHGLCKIMYLCIKLISLASNDEMPDKMSGLDMMPTGPGPSSQAQPSPDDDDPRSNKTCHTSGSGVHPEESRFPRTAAP